jgi:hypothetical protein
MHDTAVGPRTSKRDGSRARRARGCTTQQPTAAHARAAGPVRTLKPAIHVTLEILVSVMAVSSSFLRDAREGGNVGAGLIHPA